VNDFAFVPPAQLDTPVTTCYTVSRAPVFRSLSLVNNHGHIDEELEDGWLEANMCFFVID
jgi:hypothetical protein